MKNAAAALTTKYACAKVCIKILWIYKKEGISMKTVGKFLLYIPCLMLIAFYLYVLILGFYPQVSDEYRAYYIDHTIPAWPQ